MFTIQFYLYSALLNIVYSFTTNIASEEHSIKMRDTSIKKFEKFIKILCMETFLNKSILLVCKHITY